jgi:hypothetical protein
MEIWKDIAGYEGLYQVSELGSVRRFYKTRGPKVLRSGIDSGEYSYVILSKHNKQVNFKVHRLVATAFISNLNNLPCVCHKDDVKSNNCVSNLFWGSHQDNMLDMVQKGRRGNVGRKLKINLVA